MSSQTLVFGTEMRRSNKWRVYRIRTANSTYELEVEGGTDVRRCVVATCVAPADRAGERYEDSAPQLDGASLHTLSPVEWMGKCLTVGTLRTSALQSVDFVAATEARSTPTRSRSMVFTQHGPAPAPAPQPKPPSWSAFPAGQVEMVETAAVLLKLVGEHKDLSRALKDDPFLRQRLSVALSGCQLMLELINKQ
jgi:hypothetical protein